MTDNIEEAPEHHLTARVPSKDMMSHALAFLAKQNGQVWMQDEQYAYNRQKISDTIIECSMKSGLKVERIKLYGKRLTKLMRANGGHIKLATAHDLIANALGYRSYKRAFDLRGVDDFVPNLWPLEAPRGQQLLEIDGGWPSEKPCEEFTRRQAFNERRRPAIKLTEIQQKRKKKTAWVASRAMNASSGSAES